MLDRIDEVEMVIPPDSAWKYSNMAYGLLGEVVSRLSGQAYERFATSEIFDPLGDDGDDIRQRRRIQKLTVWSGTVSHLPNLMGCESRRIAI